MNISARCEYACRAVVELAGQVDGVTPLTALAIAGKREIPEKYLVHILLQLKRAGIVRSIRGAQGGYLLARGPEEISLLDVMSAVDGAVLDPLPVSGSDLNDVQMAWRAVAGDISELLDNVSIKSIMDKSGAADMYFI